MFDKLIWRYQYSKFKRKWNHCIVDDYKGFDIHFLQDLLDLTKPLSSRVIDEMYYKPNNIISTSYKTIDGFLEASVKLNSAIARGHFKTQPRLAVHSVKLGEFMTTSDGYVIDSYYSAVKAIRNTLTELITVLRQESADVQQYWLTQYRELFLTGIVFFKLLIEEHAS